MSGISASRVTPPASHRAPLLWHRVAVATLWGLTGLAIVVLFYVIGSVLMRGLPHISLRFLLDAPRDMGRVGGIGPLIIGTAWVAVLAVAVAAPLGVGAAAYLVEYQRTPWVQRIVHFGADALAGLPSILFGLFGFVFFVLFLRLGWCVLSGALTLSLMILPTILRTSEEAIRSVPQAYREVSYSLGATRVQTLLRVVLPSALPGILTGIILGIARCLAETAAVLFTVGSALRAPAMPLDSTRTLAVHFYLLVREGRAPQQAYATAALLVLLSLAINGTVALIVHRVMGRERRE